MRSSTILAGIAWLACIAGWTLFTFGNLQHGSLTEWIALGLITVWAVAETVINHRHRGKEDS
jgi:hypothetical protein